MVPCVLSLLLTGLWTGLGADNTLHVGTISSQQPALEIRKFSPLTDYLANQLRTQKIGRGKVIVTATAAEMADLMRQGRIDLFIDSPYPSVAVSHLAGSKFLLRAPEYTSVIFTTIESALWELSDLRGKVIAFDKPVSTSGYFLPKLLLVQNGFRLAHKQQPGEPVRPDEVGYVFTGSDEHTVQWVLKGRVPAGALDNHAFERERMALPNRFRELGRSVTLPRHIVSYREDLPPPLVTRIKEILLAMDQSPEGRKVLARFEDTQKFDELSPRGLAALEHLRRLILSEFRLP